jgi:hypothetical protein
VTIVVAVAIVWALSTCSRTVPPPSPSATSAPQGRQTQEQQFLAGVDKSISGAMIAGNLTKYVGDSVDLHCTIASIVDENSFDARCGERNGAPAILLVDYDDTVSLNEGQPVRIMGIVEQPEAGVDAAGKKATFPAVKAQFVE